MIRQQTGAPHLRVLQGDRELPTNRSDAVYDCVDDEVFGIPPNLITGLLTGLLGASASAVSLIAFFYLWEPYHFVSRDWLVFVALGGTVGAFLRIEWPLIRAIRYRGAQNRQQAMPMRTSAYRQFLKTLLN